MKAMLLKTPTQDQLVGMLEDKERAMAELQDACLSVQDELIAYIKLQKKHEKLDVEFKGNHQLLLTALKERQSYEDENDNLTRAAGSLKQTQTTALELALKTIQTLTAYSRMVASSVPAAELRGSAGTGGEVVLDDEEDAESIARGKRQEEIAALQKQR